jgi:hypothetical protein
MSIERFVFSDNTTESPQPLRDPGYSNFLSRNVRIAGLALFAFTAFLCVMSSIWIVKNRNHSVLRAAQATFLFPICCGAFLQACCIVFLSFDESYGTSLKTLDRLCNAIPWCFIVGNDMVYCALLGKASIHLGSFSKPQICLYFQTSRFNLISFLKIVENSCGG